MLPAARGMTVSALTETVSHLRCRLLPHRRADPRGTDGDAGYRHCTRDAAARGRTGSEYAAGADARIPSFQLFLPPCLTMQGIFSSTQAGSDNSFNFRSVRAVELPESHSLLRKGPRNLPPSNWTAASASPVLPWAGG